MRGRRRVDGERARVDLALSMDVARGARGFSAIRQVVGCSYPFGLFGNIVADLDEIRGLAPSYLGGRYGPIEPASLASPGPTGLPSRVQLPSHYRDRAQPAGQAAARNACLLAITAHATRATLLANAISPQPQRIRASRCGFGHVSDGGRGGPTIFEAPNLRARHRAM
jgi:hypothetical protein